METVKPLFSIPAPASDIKNTYTFTVIDKDGNVVSSNTYTNLTMSKRYFSKNVNNLRLVLGTMLPDDYLKYQKDGCWLKGWARKYDKDGYETHSPNDTFGVDETYPGTDKKVYSFKGRVFEEDTSLWGTAAKSIELQWISGEIRGDEVSLIGKATWGYHDPNALFNTITVGGNGKNITSGTRGNNLSGEPEQPDEWNESGMGGGGAAVDDEATYWRQDYYFDHVTSEWKLTGEWYQVTYSAMIYGLAITDAGLFSGGTMVSHYATASQTVKRPTDYLEIKVNLKYKVNTMPFGMSFIPEGNLGYGHGINSAYNGVVQYKPNSLILTGYPIHECEGGSMGSGIIPIPPNGIKLNFSEVGTDKPNDWVDEEQGEWFNFPQYRYFCSGEIYKTVTEKVKDGTDEQGNDKYIEKTSYYLNSKEQKQFQWDGVEPKTVQRLNSIAFGPVRSVILEGFSGTRASSGGLNLIPGTINAIRIGTGDGVRTKFYHPFTNETGTCLRGYYKYDNMGEANRISPYYTPGDSVLGEFLGIYNDYGELVCSSVDRNKIHDNYDSEKKYCNFGLHPFDLNYYPYGGSILGAYEWLVYRCSNTIKSAWIGMNTGKDISSGMSLRTATTIEDLFRSPRTTYVSASPSQHDQTTLNFNCDGYLAVKGGNGWWMGGYMGGLSYNVYDKAGIRISGDNEISGFIEFNEPPPNGAFIYIDAQIRVPFVHYFNGFSANACYYFGEEEDNGTDVVDLSNWENW